MFRGLAPSEAANLIAFLAGLQVDDRPWTIAEINRLLFLRAMRREGRVGGGADRPILLAST